MTVNDPDVGVAFALVIGAGAATAIGASVVFFPSLVKLASRRVLASALGLSAGVMTYVSFVEIFQKSNGSFQEAEYSEEDAYVYSTLCFFGGVVFMLFVDFLVKYISRDHHHHHHHPHDHSSTNDECRNNECEEDDVISPNCPCCSDDPVHDLETMQQMAEEKQNETNEFPDGNERNSQPTNVNTVDVDDSGDKVPSNDDGIEKGKALTKGEEEAIQENKKLVKMGINTAVAIGLHNFPEGLATFVAALDDPRVGSVLAIAIGIHNIPEGLCVALPIYYATGNRWKAFFWALVSGASEPIAALLGYAVLANSFSDELYAILFGFVAGMMVIISARELLPTAHRYDPGDTVVTYSFIAGMVIMALSMVLFVL
mmetsp:Transcript_17925/g.25291  ORF Transcript_17925/g.25291 Transcript_17925/m.25291 type:complete len:371 (-) Transcript_17925:204-1316(-)